MSTWIEMLSVENATGSLKDAYDLAKTPAGTVDNVMRIHSQRPHTMVGHLTPVSYTHLTLPPTPYV